MRGRRVSVGVVLAAVLAVPTSAYGHAERESIFPDYDGEVPEYRTDGPKLVVCKDDSKERIKKGLDGRLREKNLKLLKRCEFEDIQAAVDAAENETRIMVLPGVYKEKPSREAPNDPDNCDGKTENPFDGLLGTGGGVPGLEEESAPSYEYHFECPNAQNLIAILGDDPEDSDRECDLKCDIQIEGTGRREDVLIEGDRKKLNVIRADRADGVVLRNFTIQYSDFNNIYALETNGFRFEDIESRWSREYGFLSFTSDNGLYKDLEAFGAGDSGVYPGSGPDRYHCDGYGIEITGVDSHDNTLGYSGTAGNGVYSHDNSFHHNATGVATDSFAPGHPGMPQDCAKWEDNDIYSNNKNLFKDDRDEYCKDDYEDRDPKVVCPTFQVPVGTGLLIAGGNANVVEDNRIWDNWRNGVRLFYVPRAARGEPAGNQFDTSYDNKIVGNEMGVDEDGDDAPNGLDFWWDEEEGDDLENPERDHSGRGNCWSDNEGPDGDEPTSDPPRRPGFLGLPECPGLDLPRPGDPVKQASQASCATWDPKDNPDPPGCDWMQRPPEPE